MKSPKIVAKAFMLGLILSAPMTNCGKVTNFFMKKPIEKVVEKVKEEGKSVDSYSFAGCCNALSDGASGVYNSDFVQNWAVSPVKTGAGYVAMPFNGALSSDFVQKTVPAYCPAWVKKHPLYSILIAAGIPAVLAIAYVIKKYGVVGKVWNGVTGFFSKNPEVSGSGRSFDSGSGKRFARRTSGDLKTLKKSSKSDVRDAAKAELTYRGYELNGKKWVKKQS